MGKQKIRHEVKFFYVSIFDIRINCEKKGAGYGHIFEDVYLGYIMVFILPS